MNSDKINAELRESKFKYVMLCEDLERRLDVTHKTIEYLTERLIDQSGCLSYWENDHQERNPSPCKGELDAL